MATSHLRLDEATSISELAFLPYRGVVSAHADDASFALSVLDEDGKQLLSLPHIARTQYSDPIHLAGLLEEARLEMSKDGYALLPWSMPFQADIVRPEPPSS